MLGDHDHGIVICPWRSGVVVMYKDGVHNRLLLFDEVIVGACR